MAASGDYDARVPRRAVSPLKDFDDEGKKEFWASLALKNCKGMGARTICRLLNIYGSAFASVSNSGDWPRVGINCAEEFLSGRWRKGARQEWDAAMKLDASILLWTNSLYPELLKQITDAPVYLYLVGDAELLSPASIGVVGSRSASPEGLINAERLGQSLSASGITVVSGMASGIDSRAHEGALREIGGSVGVLGTGIDLVYPPSNKNLFKLMADKGLLVSEFAPGTPPANYNFPVRNRIISGLSLGVVVVEAAERSGSLVTAKIAIDQNREVFAVPGAPFNDRSKGCKNLVRMGAQPVFAVEDILNNLSENLKSCVVRSGAERGDSPKIDRLTPPPSASSHPEKSAKAEISSDRADSGLSPEISQRISGIDKSELILKTLRSRDSWQADDLANATNMTPQELNSVLIIMEIQGKIKKLFGANYAAID